MNPSQLEELLSHHQWVGDLARALVGEPGRADDVAQEVWTAVLRRAPEEIHSPRAWLAGVTRRIAWSGSRSERRRSRREEEVARREAIPSTQELVERSEQHSLLVHRINELPDKYRDVLLLRYYDDLPPRRIARCLDLPVNTVRTRLARGLERLRESMDEEFGDRRTWAMALLPLLRQPSPAAAAASGALSSSIGIALMTQPLKIGLALLAIAVLGLGIWRGSSPSEPKLQRFTAPVRALDRFEGESRSVPVSPAPIGERVAVAPEVVSDRFLHGRVLTLEDEPVAGAEIRHRPRNRYAPPSEIRAISDEAGRFRIPRSEVGPTELLEPRHEGFIAELEWTRWEAGEEALLRVRPLDTAVLEVEVVDAITGLPVPRFQVQATAFWGEPARSGKTVVIAGDPKRSSFSSLGGADLSGVTGWDGFLRIDEMRFVRGLPLRVTAGAPGYDRGPAAETDWSALSKRIEPVAGGRYRLHWELDLSYPERRGGARLVTGTVLDAGSGLPITGADVFVGERRVRIDERSTRSARRVLTDGGGRFTIVDPAEGGSDEVTAEHPDYDAVTIRFDDADGMELRLPPRGALTVTFVDAAGAPVPGVPYLLRGSRGEIDLLREKGYGDDEGCVQHGELLSGSYELWVLRDIMDPDEQALEHRRFQLSPGEAREERCSIGEADGVRVSGLVIANGAGPRLLPVFISHREGGGWVQSVARGVRGYEAGVVDPGRYLVVLLPDDDQLEDASMAIAGSVEVGGFGSQVIDFGLPTGSVQGHLECDHALLEGTCVVAVPVLPPEASGPGELLASSRINSLFGVRPRPDGFFELERVADGPHRVELRRGARVLASREVEVSGAIDLGEWIVGD